jgi:hypothetical protein
VYDITGEKITTLINKRLSSGNYEVSFNARNISSGMYIYKIEAGEYSDVKKMILLR